MSLRDLKIEEEYRSTQDDIVNEFYIPLLKESISYKRAVGFFSSSSLSEIVSGIKVFAQNGGKIKLIASPKLSEKDIEDIELGYRLRDEVIKENILYQLNNPKDDIERKRLSLLASLIAENILDIKIAFMENDSNVGMYHEKMGIFEDIEGNKVAFSGSMNESLTAMKLNYETIDVFVSWEGKRAERKNSVFDNIWRNEEKSIRIFEFPELRQEFLNRYYDKKEKIVEKVAEKDDKVQDNFPAIPEDIKLYDYQLEAIKNWKEKGYRGIFDMATGSGKTLTGLGAVCELSKDLDNNLFVIIVCPYQHLVEQWVEDIKRFNIKPIIGYSSSSQKDWKERLSRGIRGQNIGLSSKKFLCFICTNATFSSNFVQDMIDISRCKKLLLVDEAHNFGSPRLMKTLHDGYEYRLGLSATLDRHNDEVGTEKLYDFFGEKAIEYTLERAIKDGKLTPYKYYPILVYLTEDELVDYNNLTYEICQQIIQDDRGRKKLTEYGEILAIQRARIIAGAQNKLSKLKEVITPYRDEDFTLVYCGATNVLDQSRDRTSTDEKDLRQITAVTKILGNELDMRVAKFTSEESIEERKIIKESFEKREIQALVAIKCLDEGVNIPNIKTAFILASTTNPKEYIQRRGRVLRKSKDMEKDFAEIYDFITLPRKLEAVQYLTLEQLKLEISLVKKEILRMEEFCSLAMNPATTRKLIYEIKDSYKDNIIYFEEEEEYGECC